MNAGLKWEKLEAGRPVKGYGNSMVTGVKAVD